MNTILSSLALTLSPLASGGLEEGAVRPAISEISIDRGSLNGRSGLVVRDLNAHGADKRMVLLPIKDFKNGVIEAEIAGRNVPGARPTARGFVGIAFRVQDDPATYEAIYIRPTNGRADDQLRRNRSIQYVSMPAFPWEKLRSETPAKYESYVDLEPGAWTKIRIEVDGEKAQLFVHDTEQPALIVSDLKLGADASGGIGLWIGSEGEGWFRNVKVTKR